MKYPKSYTMKEWKRFGNKLISAETLGNEYQFFNFFTKRLESYDYITIQEMMCIKYDVILLDHKTKKEKVFEIIDKVNIKNLNAGIDKFNKGVNQFSKVIASNQPKSRIKIGISQKDYDKLFKSPRKKGNTVNFWNEDKKTRTRKAKPVQKEKTMPFYGSKKVKFF